jgi:hypothetical protein
MYFNIKLFIAIQAAIRKLIPKDLTRIQPGAALNARPTVKIWGCAKCSPHRKDLGLC